MGLPIFEMISPSIIGPSSSHIAAACRIGWAARAIAGEPVRRAKILLHESFAAREDRNGIRQAFLAGLLGLPPDTLRLKDSAEMAEDENLAFEFGEIAPGPQAHPNSVRLVLYGDSIRQTIAAASIGGGSVLIEEIDALSVYLSGVQETLLLWHHDTPGFLARVTSVLACVQTNVASIQTSRVDRGEQALTTIEVDGHLLPEVIAILKRAPVVKRLSVLPVLPGFQTSAA